MEFNPDIATEIVFAKMQIVKKDFYKKWLYPYASPGVRDIIDGIHSSALMCMFAIIYDDSSPHTILWMVLHDGKYLPIETPYSDDRNIFHEFILENHGFILNHCYAVEVSDLPTIIWRKFLGVIHSVPISHTDSTLAEVSTIELSNTLSFVSSGRHCPIEYTVEMSRSDGSWTTRILELRDDAISVIDSSKVIITDLRGKKCIKLVDAAYTVCAEKGERDIVYSDLKMRQLRVVLRDSTISYIVPSCSDGKFRPIAQRVWKERAGTRENILGKIIIVNSPDCGKKMMKIVYTDTPPHILDDEYEITDARCTRCLL